MAGSLGARRLTFPCVAFVVPIGKRIVSRGARLSFQVVVRHEAQVATALNNVRLFQKTGVQKHTAFGIQNEATGGLQLFDHQKWAVRPPMAPSVPGRTFSQ